MNAQVKKIFDDAQKLHQRGKLDEAEKLYQRALSINPDAWEVHLALAILWQMRGRIQDAVIETRRAAQECEEPNVMLWNNFGIIMKSAGLIQEAKKAYLKALELDPDAAAPKINLAVILMITGEIAKAESLLKELSESNPEDPVPWLNLARIAIAKDNLDRASECLNNVEDIYPNHPDIPMLRATVAYSNRDIKKTVEYAIQALEQNAGRSQSWQLIQFSLKDCALPLDRLEVVLHRLVTNKVQNTTLLATAIDICRKNLIWGPLPDLEEHLSSLLDKPQTLALSSSSCFSLLGCNVSQRAHKYAAEAAWNAACNRRILLKKKREEREQTLCQPLHVAFLSSDLRQHAVGGDLVGVLENLPKGRIQWYAYSNSLNDHTSIRDRIRSGFDHFVNVTQMTDQELADRICKDNIKILIDLNGITAETRAPVLAYKPALVQMTWLGMPGTIGGGDAVDYIIGDKWVTPLSLADGFDEKILQLPRSYHSNDHIPPDFSIVGSREKHHLPEDAVVFCCFNQTYKFSPETFVLWGQIMQAVPNSVLWLMNPAKTVENEEHGTKYRLEKQLESVGISADRLILAKNMPHEEHVARLSLADLVLDTLPYNLHTSCSDAIRAGTPVITLPGTTFAGRVAASILDTANLKEWIAATPEEYVQKTVAFASQSRSEINAIKKCVYETYLHSPLPDNVAFAHLLEKMFLNLYEWHATGHKATAISINSEGEVQQLSENCSTSGV